MQQLQPDGATFLLQTAFLPALKSEHTITKNIIGAIPEGKEEFRPDEISKNAMELAWHIAVSEMRFLDAVSAGAFEFTPQPKPDSVRTSADLNRWYSDNFETRLSKVVALSGDQLAKIVDFRGMFQLPAVMYLGFILHHTVHHRGQLSTYLRPMGAKVPSIYGESYDAAEARKAAQKIS
ncbi:MAG: DinB family protein [Bryobacteraceae bacterium]